MSKVTLVRIEPLNPDNAAAITRQAGGNGWKNDASFWTHMYYQQQQDGRQVLVAMQDGAALGYGSLLWQSDYAHFLEAGTPEIHDLAVAADWRGNGIATNLIGALERCAHERGHQMVGLGVGLYHDYGPAQRLYAALGYRPDGHGITYRNARPEPGAMVWLDDDLVLWMTKTLGQRALGTSN